MNLDSIALSRLFFFHFPDDILLFCNGFLDEYNFSNNGPLLVRSPIENKAVEIFILKGLKKICCQNISDDQYNQPGKYFSR